MSNSSPEAKDGLYPDQHRLVALIAAYKFVCAYGSSRGGKTYAFFFILLMRALTFPGSNHCVIRQTAASIPSTLWPTVMAVLKAVAPGYRDEVDINNSTRCITLHNGSTIWFFGCQDDEAVEKIMGAEFATIFLNEIVNISFDTYQKILTRLNARDTLEDGTRIELKLFADCNPKAKSHWVYQQWVRKVVPGTERPLAKPERFVTLAFDRYSNPGVDPDYYDEFLNQDEEKQARFLKGEWYDEVEGALFSATDLALYRRSTPALTDFSQTVVAIDPSVSNSPTSDETGIVVAGAMGEGEEAHFYPIADLSGRYHPHEWASKAVDAYWRYGCKAIVVEINQGGNQNAHTLRTIDPRVNVVEVRPGQGQGKNERAKPIAAVLKAGRLHHPFDNEPFKELEAQMLAMTGDYDRKNGKSPDRLDAFVYAVSELLTGRVIKPVVVSRIAGWFN